MSERDEPRPEDICPNCGADWRYDYTESCPVCMEDS